MTMAEQMMGIQRADMDGVKEVKVKLPVKHLLRLHYLKLTTGRTFSDLVTEALMKQFEQADAERQATQ